MLKRTLIYVGWTFAALLLLAFVTGAATIYHYLYRPLPLKQPTIIEVNKASSASALVHQLYTRHLITSEKFLRWFIKMQGLSTRLKAGIYQIHPGETAHQLLYRIANGDVLIETFRIIEGTTQKQIALNLSHTAFLKYTPADWSKLKIAYSSIEGLLLADSYQYTAGEASFTVLQRAYTNLQQYLTYSWQTRASSLPYKNPYELLIAASILEKETALPNERRLIAGVIVNRLHKFMPLQMDPTVIYGLGERYTGKLTHTDIQIDTPYNTYLHRGLPPTPIAMVGKAAIDAAAHPQITEYLYFVAKGDGSHQFSVNYSEQQQAIKRYLRTNNAK